MVHHSSGVDDIMALISHKLSSIYQKRQIDEMNTSFAFVAESMSERSELIIKSLEIEILYGRIDYYFVAFYISMILFVVLGFGKWKV